MGLPNFQRHVGPEMHVGRDAPLYRYDRCFVSSLSSR
jgi:hypothetical protein